MKITKPHAAMFASPGMGHVIPAIELGKRLARFHGFHVTIFVLEADAASVQSQFLSSPGCDSTLIDVISLPPPDISGLVDPSAFVGTKIMAMMRETVPVLRSKIAEMRYKPTALVLDMLGLEALKLGGEFNMLTYLFIPSNARFVSLMMYFPTLEKDVAEDHIFKKKDLVVPGCEPVRFEDTFQLFLDPSSQVYRECYLPQDFITRNLERGLVVPSWAPQTEILAHSAVGGFLTHCGWNSILESTVSGIPMIAWPLFAEQMTNATLLNEELGIAVRSKTLPSKGVISRVEIEALVRRIMVEEEGCEMRKKVKKLKETAEKSRSSDDGSAHDSLSRVAEENQRLLEHKASDV
ncbi:unnamed protein product [Cochlearia groenlandica]